MIATNIAAWAWAYQAVDADHIAAIDNAVRKLMQDGERAIDAGLLFSLDHSTVGVLTSLAIAATIAAAQGGPEAFKAIGRAIDTSVSIINLAILRGVAATQAAQGMSRWHTLAFPARCTAGMALVDTTDSILMVGACDRALVQPLRKLWRQRHHHHGLGSHRAVDRRH